MTKRKQTARELYDERREDIARVLDWIELELGRHDAAAKNDPTNWGYVGSVGEVRNKLIVTLGFLAGMETSEIKNLLSECR